MKVHATKDAVYVEGLEILISPAEGSRPYLMMTTEEANIMMSKIRWAIKNAHRRATSEAARAKKAAAAKVEAKAE